MFSNIFPRYGGGALTWRPLALTVVVLWIAALSGCGGAAAPENADAVAIEKNAARRTLRAATAANLQFAFEAIEQEFERRHPDVDLVGAFGSSGAFYAQLTHEAPFDIFFSADTLYPQRLADEGFAAPDGYFPYARGRLVVWTRNDSTLDLERLGAEALLDPSIQKIALANPRLAPYGAAAETAFRRLGVYEQVKDRLVQGENISQAAQFVESGAADVGFIALSLALAPSMQTRGRYWEVPQDAYDPIEQAGVVLAASENRDAAEQLRDFVIGEPGQRILREFGYSSPGE